MIKETDIVSPILSDSIKYKNKEFKQWLIDHKDKTYYVQKTIGDSCKLAKVDFWITKEFLRRVR